SAQPQQAHPAVPVLHEQRLDEVLGSAPEHGRARYRPRRVGMVWRSKVSAPGP
ncbi:hypothetical protein GA0115255_102521, partial [Streptomyces sp. Ncost-T6T-2b]